MLGHDHIGVNAQLESAAHAFESKFESAAARVRGQQWMAAKTAKGNKMALASLLIALESPGHKQNLLKRASAVCDE